jgi:sulfoxide reductase heme-binding subunit YedZ
MTESQLTWLIARAAGLLAYLLTTASVVLGLVLHHRWRSASWPRFVTNELHRTVSLLALGALAGHGLALLLDPYLAPAISELLIPLTISYRPLWVAVGIIAGYLLVGLWLSQYLRPWIGYRAWARLHLLTYAAWVLALVHGLAAGSDTSTPWALLIYGGSVSLVGGLVVARILDTEPEAARLLGLGAASLIFAVVALWAIGGPLAPDWSARAGSSPARGRTALAGSTDAGSPAALASPGPASTGLAFTTSFVGAIGVERLAGGRALVVQGRFADPAAGSLAILIGSSQGPSTASQLVLRVSGQAVCTGVVTELDEATIAGGCQSADGAAVGVRLLVTGFDGRRITGTLVVGPLGSEGNGRSSGPTDEREDAGTGTG